MSQSNRIISALTTLVIIGSTMTFAYGQSLALLSQYFSLSYLNRRTVADTDVIALSI